MTAKRYLVRIIHLGHEKAAWTIELDLDNEARLREVFTDAADKHNNTSKVRDYAEWRLDIHKWEKQRGDHKGRLLASMTVDSAGRTEVARW